MVENDIKLGGRRAVVTGGGSGLGQATVERFLRSGAQVAAWDRSQSALASLQEEFGDRGTLHTVQVNVADRAGVAAAAEQTTELMGGLDLVVNSAGVALGRQPIEQYPDDAWDTEIAVNLTGTFNVCRALVPALIANDYGRIVNVASVAAKDGNANQVGYVASKGGVIALTKSIAKELATTGVLVNAITPTAFDTPMFRTWETTGDPGAGIRARIPMGRLGRPDEAAALIAWLCSDDCSFTTGQVLDLSGGRASY